MWRDTRSRLVRFYRRRGSRVQLGWNVPRGTGLDDRGRGDVDALPPRLRSSEGNRPVQRQPSAVALAMCLASVASAGTAAPPEPFYLVCRVTISDRDFADWNFVVDERRQTVDLQSAQIADDLIRFEREPQADAYVWRYRINRLTGTIDVFFTRKEGWYEPSPRQSVSGSCTRANTRKF